MKHTVVFRLESIHYRGEAVGNDWTFYFRTLAGLTRIDSSIQPQEADRTPRVIGIAEVENTEEITDTWWVSVIEKDMTQDDRAVSSRHQVPLFIEPGAEYMRTISVDVADTGRIGRNDRATLDFEIIALVLDANEETPDLIASPTPQDPGPDIEYPTDTAGSFPHQFEAIAEGVNPRSVPVVASLEAILTTDKTGSSQRDNALVHFREAFTNTYPLPHLVPEIALYRIANAEGKLFWSSQNSSQGLRSQARIINALNDAIPPQGGKSPAFQRHRNALVTELLEPKFTGDFGAAATALANIILSLTTDRPERTSVNRDVYVRTEELNWFSGIWRRAFFVEPTPFSGPDNDIWLVVWTDGWSE